MFPIFVTFSSSSICSPSQMTLPTVENSRLEHVRVLFWYQTPISLIALIALVSFSQKLPETLPVCVLWFKQDECQGDLEEKDLHKRGKDLHRMENICTERKRFAQRGKALHREEKWGLLTVPQCRTLKGMCVGSTPTWNITFILPTTFILSTKSTFIMCVGSTPTWNQIGLSVENFGQELRRILYYQVDFYIKYQLNFYITKYF